MNQSKLKKLDNLKFYSKFFLIGIFTSFIFPPFFLIPVGFIVFPLLFFIITKSSYKILSYKKNFISGFIYGLGFFTIYLFWIKEPFLVNSNTSNYFVFSYLLIIYCALYFGFIFILLKYFNKNILKLIMFPGLVIFFEFICSNFIYGFPWFSFSLVHSNNIIGTTLVYYLGTYGLSYITILVFIFPAIFFMNNYLYKKLFFYIYISIMIMILGLISLKLNKKNEINYEKMTISLVQLDYPINQYTDITTSQKKLNEIIAIIKENNTDIMVFGENDFPFLMDQSNIELLQTNIKLNQNLIIGSTRKEFDNYYNSLFSMSKKNIKKFDKKILVPFGEFLPFRSLLSFMENISGDIDFQKGSSERILNFSNNYNFIPVICYEIMFFWKLLNKQNNQANFIVNLTNDSWFGNFSGPYQHFYFTKLRAAEFNKPILRVSNNGVSGVINNNGDITDYIKLNEKKIKITEIDISSNNINYLGFHKIFLILLLTSLILGFIFNKKNERI